MTNKVYVGNLNFSTTENELRDFFKDSGTISSVKIIMDHMTGKSRGFAFVEMETAAQAQQAIDALNGQELSGNTIRVNEARDNKDRGGRDNRNRGGGDRHRGGGDRNRQDFQRY